MLSGLPSLLFLKRGLDSVQKKTSFNSANSACYNQSEKQYKDRLAAWHIRKNIKAKEVHVMIRKQQKRAARGKQTAFRVGGQEVDSKRISRFVRRYGSSWENSGGSPGAAGAVSGRFSGDPKSPPISYSPEPGIFFFSFFVLLFFSCMLFGIGIWNQTESRSCRYPDRHELLYSRTRR